MIPRLRLLTAGALGALLLGPTSLAQAEAGGHGAEHVGTWLNWLFQVKVAGHPLVTDPAQLACAWSLTLVLALMVTAVIGGRRFSVRPGPFQMLLETGLGALRTVVESVMGPRGGGFIPFLATIFIYVFLMNVLGMLPGALSPTSSLSTTGALGLMVFVVVQSYGLRRHGIGYFRHFLEGLPLYGFFWVLAPLVFVIHLIGEVFRPISLALRLFGNVTAEETVAITMLGLVAAGRVFIPIPVHWPMLLLGLLTSFVQALIFALLTAVYLAGVLAHEEGTAR